MKVFLLFSFIIIAKVAHSQNDWQGAGILYKDSYVTVNLEYKLSTAICITNNKFSRYRYIVSGRPRGFDFYVNWKMDFDNCKGDVICQTNSVNVGRVVDGNPTEDIDWVFAGPSLSQYFYDVRGDLSPDQSPVVTVTTKLTAPREISGNRYMLYGDSTQLTVDGGSLSKGAIWRWYKNACGGIYIGSGKTIWVKPDLSCTYFVKGESSIDKTTCVSIDINVDGNSEPPTSISKERASCSGGREIKLSVLGGRLGKNAQWVWYTEGCERFKAGTGQTIVVLPTQNITYYVRAEGISNVTPCVAVTLDPNDNIVSVSPTSITGVHTTCAGQNITLSVNGGKLAFDQKWTWYRSYVSSGNQVGTGVNITVSPIQTDTYYVIGEGPCGNTSSVSATVVTETASTEAKYIAVNRNSEYRGAKIRLQRVGGYLGINSKWVWYKQSHGARKKIGSGESISVKLQKSQEIYLRAEGNCKVTQYISRKIDIKPRFFFINAGIVANNSTNIAKLSSKPFSDSSKFTFTIGSVKQYNWYVRAKFSLFAPLKTSFTCDNNSVLNYSAVTTNYKFSGRTSDYRFGITGGLLYGKKNLYATIGLGYGKRELDWEFDEFYIPSNAKTGSNWAKHTQRSAEGIEVEAGFLYKLSFLNIMGGVSGISNLKPDINFKYFDAYVGVGLNF